MSAFFPNSLRGLSWQTAIVKSTSTRSIKRELNRIVRDRASMKVAPFDATKDGEVRCETKCWITPESFGGPQVCR